MILKPEDLQNPYLVLGHLKRYGCCPICGERFSKGRSKDCSHEPGWYREWIALLLMEAE